MQDGVPGADAGERQRLGGLPRVSRAGGRGVKRRQESVRAAQEHGSSHTMDAIQRYIGHPPHFTLFFFKDFF